MEIYKDLNTGEEVSEHDLQTRYDEMLDECYPDLIVCGLNYSSSRTLQEVDPIAYRCGFNDWLDSELGETLEETDNA